MEFSRTKKAKLNIIISLLSQGVTLVCGLIVPKLMLDAFGSEVNGAVSSITQFLGYITLLEAGIGGVTRAALYKSLAEKDKVSTAKILNEVKHFFAIIGAVFFVYVLVLAASFQKLSHIECFGWFSTALLVVILSLSTFAQYFIGITNSVLLQASQKHYITTGINMTGTAVNAVATAILIYLGSSIHVVKLVSSIVFIMKPVVLWLIVKKTYQLPKVKERDKEALNQKWAGMGQHIAFVLHSNTDIAVLTVFKSLSLVSVYYVYNMVVANIQNISSSFAAGMEAVFGDMLTKKEADKLHKTFGYFETLISLIAVTLFSVASVLITPFVKLYTANLTDADYYQPAFGIMLIISAVLYCLRQPYHSMVYASGSFKQTRTAAYGEAVVNIVSSVILVIRFGLIGVAIGTVMATLFRFIFYVYYLSKNVIFRNIGLFIKREIVNIVAFVLPIAVGTVFLKFYTIDSYFSWAVAGVVVTGVAGAVNLLLNYIFYKDHLKAIIGKIIKR